MKREIDVLESKNEEQVTNGAEDFVQNGIPYRVEVEITGSADLLFHAWNCEAIADKAAAKKNSETKKTDNVESFVYRDEDGFICLPGEYLRQSITWAAKFKQDPRSPRKSARDLYTAGVVSLTPLASLGSKDWDYLDKRRVVVQRNGITRLRPTFKAGWKATVVFLILTPEYVSPSELLDTIGMAGRLVGVGDFRPTYGRFAVTSYKILKDDSTN